MRLYGIIQLSRSDLAAVSHAIEYIYRNYRNNISPDYLAEEIGLDVRKLRAGFKRQTNLTVHQFLMKVRILNSQICLADTDCSLKLIASKNGFKNPSQFGKLFKKQTGFTPMQFRLSIDLLNHQPTAYHRIPLPETDEIDQRLP